MKVTLLKDIGTHKLGSTIDVEDSIVMALERNGDVIRVDTKEINKLPSDLETEKDSRFIVIEGMDYKAMKAKVEELGLQTNGVTYPAFKKALNDYNKSL